MATQRRFGRADSSAEGNELGARATLVGREAQVETLLAALRRAIDFHSPQLVTVVGNQGTGKTRLIRDALSRADPSVRAFFGRAEPDGAKGSALSSLLRDRFALASGETDAAVRERFAATVRSVMGAERIDEILHFLGRFVGLEYPQSAFLRQLADTPRHGHDIARTILRRFFESDAARSPLVLVFDDLQWADDATLTIINELAGGLGGSSAVIIAATRPEMLVRVPGWGSGESDHERIDLRNLEGDDAEQMFRSLLAPCGTIGDDLAQRAVEMTGGNPHFIVQLVRLFVANGAVDTAGPRWRLDAQRAAATELPISIEEAIEARVAALERDERELLEKAAVFGSVFWVSAVVALTRLEDKAADAVPAPLDYDWGEGERARRHVSDVIAALADRDYVLPLEAADSTLPGDIEIAFKHNLERELIMRSTEPARLARYYVAAAEWLESRITRSSEEQLEYLAGLYEHGGDRQRASRCYMAGAERARVRYAMGEARALYGRALEMLGDGDGPARMSVLHDLGDVLDQAGDSEGAREKFLELMQLAWRYDNLGKAGAAHRRLARIARRSGGYELAMEHLRRAHDLFSRAQDDRGIGSTLDDMGTVHWLRGAYGQALDYHRQALTLRRGLGDRRSIALSLANIGRVHHDSGNFKAAVAQLREALDLRRDIGDLVGVVESLCDLAGVYGEDGNSELALELLTEARAVSDNIGDKSAMAEVLSRAGEVKTAIGRTDEAIADLDQACQLATELGDRGALAIARRRLAESHLSMADVESAERQARASLAIGEELGSRTVIGCAHRVLAELAAATDQTELATQRFRSAVEILAAVKHEVELARAYRAFSRLCARVGNHDEANKLRTRADEIFVRLKGAAANE